MTAPIDGVTDSPMRQLIREFSPDILMFTEMRHVACVANEKKEQSLRYNTIEHPLCFQISAHNSDFVALAIEKILNAKFDMINLNAGCPAKAVIKSGAGSALMAKSEMLKNILLTLKKEINGHVPLTLKMRAGFKEKNAMQVAQIAQELDLDCLIIHPRTQLGGFASPLDYKLVKKIKETVCIPVIFSGNLMNFERVKKTYELTGVDGFMIGRALYGSPWKVHEIMQHAQEKEFSVSLKTTIEYALKHLKLATEFYGEKVGFQILKQHIPQYIKYLENAGQIRKNLVISRSKEEMENKLKTILAEIE